jgi:UTP--glucose-1-phosphate uridylyltransferase
LIKKAIIPAAGYGTRGLPITKVLPKEMFPICGRPAIDFLVDEAVKSGIEQILIIVSRSKNMIMDYFDHSMELEAHIKANNKENLLKELSLPNVHIQYVRQSYARELGEAVLLGKHFAGGAPFAVMLPDEILLSDGKPPLLQLIQIHQKYKGNVIGLKKIALTEIQQYGVVKPQILNNPFEYKITDIIEKPLDNPPSNLAVIGRYILLPEILKYLETIEPGVGGEIQLTDAIKEMLIDFPCHCLDLEASRFDISKTADYVKLINLIYHSSQPPEK